MFISILLIIGLYGNMSADDNNIFKDLKFSFEFKTGSNILESSYLENREELYYLSQFTKNNLNALKLNQTHLRIISYIKMSQKDNMLAINRASTLASVVRAYLKTRYGLNNSNFAFYIDYTSDNNDKVTVEFKPYSVRKWDNQDIFFTEDYSYNKLILTILKYGEIPYLNSEKDKNILFEREHPHNLKSKELNVTKSNDNIANTNIIVPVEEFSEKKISLSKLDTLRYRTHNYSDVNYKSVEANNSKIQAETSNSGEKSNNKDTLQEKSRIIRQETKKIESVKSNATYTPKLGIGSNILSWAAVNNVDRKLTANISLEYFYSDFTSIKADGHISPFSNNKMEGTEWWKVSSLTLENRFWFGQRGKFKGLYSGIFGLYGDFDIKKADNTLGSTGTFYGAGITLGYSVNILKWLSLDAALKGVYRVDEWNTYEVKDGGFFLRESKSQSGFHLHDYVIGLTIRYVIKK